MLEMAEKGRAFRFVCFTCMSLLLAAPFCAAGEEIHGADASSESSSDCRDSQEIWDPAKYIGIDEIRPGMEAYCLTCFQGTQAQKFDVEVLSVVRNMDPGRDAILVKVTDERFIHTGPVAGCSGSPVYIDGRLAGALSFAWTYSKDPIFGATPIQEMLKVGRSARSQRPVSQGRLALDFSKPLDLSDVGEQMGKGVFKRSRTLGGANPLPDLLVISGLSPGVCEELAELVQPSGIMLAASGSGGDPSPDSEKAPVEPGACLAVPWVSGDIDMAWLGTVTDVVDDKVYGFGHGLLEYGPVDLPMATGEVYTVVPSLLQSFKIARVRDVIGALRQDESAAVVGRIGAEAQTIPLTIRLERYNDTEVRTYNCQLANNRILTPNALQLAVAGAALQLGGLPPDHTIEYEVAIGVGDTERVSFKNVSTDHGLLEMLMDGISSVGLLMNNPYQEVDIRSIDFGVHITPESKTSHIWSVELSDTKVKAGQAIQVTVVVESVLAKKKKYRFSLKMPEQLKPGKYQMMVCGSSGYEQFLRKAVPYRFIAQDMPSLIKALNDALSVERDKLYCLLVLPAAGVALERAELPDLPATKALVFQDARRALKTRPYPHWLQKKIDVGTVVIDNEILSITVEK